MSVYLSKGVHSFGEAETVINDAAKASGANPPWVGVTFHSNNNVALLNIDGTDRPGIYGAGTTIYGEITAITGAGGAYTLYKAKVDH